MIDTDRCQKCTRAKIDLGEIETLIADYMKENKAVPDDYKVLFKKPMLDPWGFEYHFATFQVKEFDCFDVWSFGSDNRPGGSQIHEKDIYSGLGAGGKCLTNLGARAR